METKSVADHDERGPRRVKMMTMRMREKRRAKAKRVLRRDDPIWFASRIVYVVTASIEIMRLELVGL
jgi:hypothetical protein